MLMMLLIMMTMMTMMMLLLMMVLLMMMMTMMMNNSRRKGTIDKKTQGRRESKRSTRSGRARQAQWRVGVTPSCPVLLFC